MIQGWLSMMVTIISIATINGICQWWLRTSDAYQWWLWLMSMNDDDWYSTILVNLEQDDSCSWSVQMVMGNLHRCGRSRWMNFSICTPSCRMVGTHTTIDFAVTAQVSWLDLLGTISGSWFLSWRSSRLVDPQKLWSNNYKYVQACNAIRSKF